MIELLLVIGFLTIMVSGLLYAFCMSKFKKTMTAYDKNGLYKLGLDTLSDMFGPTAGTKSAQDFFLKRLYLQHPDQSVKETAHNVFLTQCGMLSGFVLMIVSFFISALIPS